MRTRPSYASRTTKKTQSASSKKNFIFFIFRLTIRRVGFIF